MTSIRSILVVCEGNHCRSPLAEGFLRHHLAPWVQVQSAGLGALIGHPADEEVRGLMAEFGIPIEGHRGQALGLDLVLNADLILVMDQAQLRETISRFPTTRGRVFLLGHWLPETRREITDPYRQGPQAMRDTFVHIQEALAPWLSCLMPKHA